MLSIAIQSVQFVRDKLDAHIQRMKRFRHISLGRFLLHNARSLLLLIRLLCTLSFIQMQFAYFLNQRGQLHLKRHDNRLENDMNLIALHIRTHQFVHFATLSHETRHRVMHLHTVHLLLVLILTLVLLVHLKQKRLILVKLEVNQLVHDIDQFLEYLIRVLLQPLIQRIHLRLNQRQAISRYNLHEPLLMNYRQQNNQHTQRLLRQCQMLRSDRLQTHRLHGLRAEHQFHTSLIVPIEQLNEFTFHIIRDRRQFAGTLNIFIHQLH
mmetsp:Transcript_19263/g.30548  ORF Transcript_19263/g.30548 Transcript_19263/m.30548 type:complete len:266 (+) Transcript_19263:103-900(+)